MKALIRIAVVSLATLGLTAILASEAEAAQRATITNNSSVDVLMRVRWSHLPGWSVPFYLAPGESRVWTGPDLATMFIAWDATPGIPDPLRIKQVGTLFVWYGDILNPGASWFFREAGYPPFVAVGLYPY
jgi:hypothetical protein